VDFSILEVNQLDRRCFIAGSAAALPILANAWSMGSAQAQTPPNTGPFNANLVRELARKLAESPFRQPDRSLPDELRDVDYDAYRAIRFRPEQALWRNDGLPFQAQFFHRGFIFTDRIDVYEVSGGVARPIRYSPNLFDYGKTKPPPADADIGFAGFRLHTPMNRADYYDEVAVFLGASYFRAVAKGQVYGLSARGLSIRTADPGGEEFPAFRTFWIEKPDKHARSIVVHALLDSESTTAAFRFTIRPGDTTIYDVEMAMYPRVEIAQAGIGSLTSMFLFDANDRIGVDDFRPAVHDSDGLAIRNGRGEEIWRPLTNPRDLQVSIFSDGNPRGYGLLQQERDFHGYEDLESRFEKRPSLWVEPIGDWGNGAVQLVEIPTKEEIHDNIVAFWRPRNPLAAKREHTFTYRLHWGVGKADAPPLAQFIKTRVGAGTDGTRRFVIEAVGGILKDKDPNTLRGTVTVDKGEVRNLVVQPNPLTKGWRVSFELATNKQPVIELRAQLFSQDEAISEVWIYRWSA
jgi:glucans biosynthesis protein